MPSDTDALLYAPDLFGNARPEAATGSLAEEFFVPPLSVLDGKTGWWLERRKAWLSRGIRSEEGRSGDLLSGFKGIAALDGNYRALKEGKAPPANKNYWQGSVGTSVFDPVLCELAYRWFCPPAGSVLDPFAGGSVRGIVASCLGLRYLGADLREEQCEANRAQAASIVPPGQPAPVWVAGDCRRILPLLREMGAEADFVFTCPPYGHLERYSDNPDDLSTLRPPAFREAYAACIAAAAEALNPDRFAAFVVASYRDGDRVCDLPGWTVAAAEAAGLTYYNDCVFTPRGGTAALRARNAFTYRKVTPCHQRLLVFVKGNAQRATAALSPVPDANPTEE
jgi:hypothetical protein